MNFFGRLFFTISKLGIFIRHWEYRLLFALGTGPYFGLILNPKRNAEFSVTKAKISCIYLCVSLCRDTSTLKKKMYVCFQLDISLGN